jgi:hypothetical protein
MTTTTLANVVSTLQNDIVSILRADNTVFTVTFADGTTETRVLDNLKIVDGIPTKQLREGGFPLIVVHTPEVDESRLTMTKHRSEMTVHVEIIDRKEGNVRVITDRIKDALQNAQSTTKGDGYWWYGRRVRSNLNFTFLPNEEGKAVWHMNLFFTYLWSGN